ncbi:chorismate mutase [bacterium]|nr:chorismate mutase [bacterium]
MRNLEDVRKDITNIDIKMKDLFIERMNLIKEVKDIKKMSNLPIEDSTRESLMKENYTKELNEFKEEYLEFLNKILEISKNSMR